MELFLFDRNTWNRLTVYKKMRSGSFKINKIFTNYMYLICMWSVLVV